MKWHGAWLYGGHRTCAKTAAISCGTSHASAVSTPLQWISVQKRTIKKKLVTHVESHASTASLLESREQCYIKVIIIIIINIIITLRESALKADSGRKNPLPHQGLNITKHFWTLIKHFWTLINTCSMPHLKMSLTTAPDSGNYSPLQSRPSVL